MSGHDPSGLVDSAAESVPLTDPVMPSDLLGVIGYCSDKTVGEIPGSLVSPPAVHKCIQDAKNYLFGSELESSMRASLKDYAEVILYIVFFRIFLDIWVLCWM